MKEGRREGGKERSGRGRGGGKDVSLGNFKDAGGLQNHILQSSEGMSWKVLLQIGSPAPPGLLRYSLVLRVMPISSGTAYLKGNQVKDFEMGLFCNPEKLTEQTC